jgi:hypothetical protein
VTVKTRAAEEECHHREHGAYRQRICGALEKSIVVFLHAFCGEKEF